MSPTVTSAPAATVPDRRARPTRRRPERRPRRRRLSRVQRLLALGTVLVLLLVSGWIVGFSSLLNTRVVSVTGLRILSQESVHEAAAVPMGRPLMRQDTQAIATRVSRLRPVQSVRIERRWPHTLVVSVVERTPMLAVASANAFELVDRSGTAYATVPAPPPGAVPAKVDLTSPDVLAEAAAVVAGLTPALAERVTRIEAASPNAVTVVVDDRISVMWGSATQSPLKSEITVALLTRKPKTLDVSSPHNPAIR